MVKVLFPLEDQVGEGCTGLSPFFFFFLLNGCTGLSLAATNHGS